MIESTAPLISFVLPTYNVEQYIPRCINSLKNQDFKNFEMIFVDDCGTDGSIKTITNFQNQDSRIHILINDKNEGTLKSRINGAQHSKGRFIFFLDPDDEIPENCLGKLSALLTNEDPDILVCNVLRLPRANFKVDQNILPKDALYPNILNSLFIENKKPFPGTPGKIYKKDTIIEAFTQISNTNDRLYYGEDALTFLLAANVARKLCVFKEVAYIYYQNESSITKRISKESLINRINQLNLIVEIIKSNSENEILHTVDAKKAANIVVERLQKDMAMLAIQLVSVVANKDSFIISSIGKVYIEGNWKAYLRVALLIASLGFLRV